jgi:hypothetical protein
MRPNFVSTRNHPGCVAPARPSLAWRSAARVMRFNRITQALGRTIQDIA